jgi:uncharacterized protein YdhG (YjbR/CyaY superfamily)
MIAGKPNNIDEYIAGFPQDIREIMEQCRMTIKEAAPLATEVISYGMPAYKLNGILVWFAAYSKHLGFYPKASGIEMFKKELSTYKSAKGSVQFPLDKPLPLELIAEIVKFRVAENLQKAESKIKK